MAARTSKKLNFFQLSTIAYFIISYDKAIFKRMVTKRTIFKALISTALVIYVTYIYCLTQPSSVILNHLISNDHSDWKSVVPETNLRHLVFGIASSLESWKTRNPYINSWWRQNQTRGFVFLDRAPTNVSWPDISPPFQISGDISMFKNYDHHGMPFAIRMTRVILETFNMNFTNVRWFVMADDDTVLFVDNLVEVLKRYDHRKYYYIGSISECSNQNAQNSFEMAFGGAGYAMSYPLVRDLSKMLDGCIMRYPYLYGSDHILKSCINEIGGHLTKLPGFHQFDLRGDISGFLSAHPPGSPVLSFHHIDSLDPIFPNMSRGAALRHLMEAANTDHSRLLRQSVCFEHNHNLSFSISWGYSVNVYEQLLPPGYLQIPLQTFHPWNYPMLFNVRPVTDDPCQMPHNFFFEEVQRTSRSNLITTHYIRKSPRGLPACANNSADSISRIVVLSPILPFKWDEGKRECCMVTQKNSNITEIMISSCLEGEGFDWS